MSDSEIIKNLNIKENELKKYVILRVYKDSKKKKIIIILIPLDACQKMKCSGYA